MPMTVPSEPLAAVRQVSRHPAKTERALSHAAF